MHDDARTQRDRTEGLADDLDRALGDDAPCSSVELVKTFTETTYPTTAGALYACKVQLLSGAEVEGGAGTVTATTAELYAYNLGTAVPPSGTLLLATQVGDRWTVRYDG